MTRTCLIRPVKRQDPTYIMVRWTIIFRSNKPCLVLLTNIRMVFAQKHYLIPNLNIGTIISWFLERPIFILYIVVYEYGICLI